MKKNQHGIAHLSLILLVLIGAVVAFAGYRVMKSNQTQLASSSKPPAATTKPVQTIQSKADLKTVEINLESQNIDSGLNPTQFDQDINSLL